MIIKLVASPYGNLSFVGQHGRVTLVCLPKFWFRKQEPYRLDDDKRRLLIVCYENKPIEIEVDTANRRDEVLESLNSISEALKKAERGESGARPSTQILYELHSASSSASSTAVRTDDGEADGLDRERHRGVVALLELAARYEHDHPSSQVVSFGGCGELLPLTMRLFIDQLFATRRHIRRQYVEEYERFQLIRGQPDPLDLAIALASSMPSFNCRY